MAKKNIKSKDYKIGFSNIQKKNGINFWRFFFSGINSVSKESETFFIEFELLNPSLSPDKPFFSDLNKPFSPNDLQAALIGDINSLGNKKKEKSSYCVLRIGKLGQKSKQLCQYFAWNDASFSFRPFEIKIGNKLINEYQLSGFINVDEQDSIENPTLYPDYGYSNWNLEYYIQESTVLGYKDDKFRWFPFGKKTIFAGKLNFNGIDYIIDPKGHEGYIERFYGNAFINKWVHINCSEIISLITGKRITDSSFCIHGVFGKKLTFLGNLENISISLFADKLKHSYDCVFDCTQMPGNENAKEQLLHWSLSFNDKKWIIDIDVFCKVSELINKIYTNSEDSTTGLNILEGGTGFGEIKFYKQNKKSIEQIEHAKISKVICEYGNIDSLI